MSVIDEPGATPLPLVLNRPRALELLREDGIDVLIGASSEGAFYLSGFQSLSRWIMRGSTVMVFGVLGGDGTTTLIAPAGEMDRFACEPVAVDRVLSFGSIAADRGDVAQWKPADHQLAAHAISEGRPASVWEALDAVITPGQRIAVDDLDLIEPLRRRYGSEVIDGRAVLSRMRLIKSDEEVARLSRAVAITERALRASMERVRDGISERELAVIFDHAVLTEGGTPCMAAIGFGGFGAHGNHVPGEQRVRPGDLIRWDVGGEFRGYPADIARSGVLGRPSAEQRREWEAVLAGQRAAIGQVRPGQAAADIYRVAVAEARAAGLPDFAPKHIGHGIGIGMYEPPLIAPGDETVLEAGMVVELELINKVLGRGGMHVEDTVLVTEDGAQLLTSMAHELFVLPPARESHDGRRVGRSS